MCGIVRFLRKSLSTEELSVKYKIKLSMEYFDSEALIKQQEIGSFKIPTRLPGQTCLQMTEECLSSTNVVENGKVTC